MKRDIIYLLICGVLIAAIAWLWRKPADIVTHTEVDTVYVETTVYDTVHPTPITLIETIYDTIVTGGEDIGDMIAENVIAEFYATKFYDDVLKDDNEGYVRIQSKISQNSLVDRKLFFESRYTNQVITKYVNERELYFMPSLMASRQSVGGSVGLIYKSRLNRLYSLQVGYLGYPYIGIGYGWRF